MRVQRNKIKSGEQIAVTVLALPKVIRERWNSTERRYEPSDSPKDERYLILVYDYDPQYKRDSVYLLNITPKLFSQLDKVEIGNTYVINAKAASFTANDKLVSYIKYDVTRPVDAQTLLEDVDEVVEIYNRYADDCESIYDYYRKLANIEEWGNVKKRGESLPF